MVRVIHNLSQREQLNFLLTNRIPRRLLTRFMGWYSRIRSPLLTRFSLRIWRIFADDLDLHESRRQQFDSLHDCFIRELKDGVRPIDRRDRIVISPCDAIVGEVGNLQNLQAIQAKGFPYALDDLLPERALVDGLRNGIFLTLRLRSTMYHRFHAPVDCGLKNIQYISGDTWNVNPIALKRIENLFCKNERAVLRLQTALAPGMLVLVPVAAILVASMRFHCLDFDLDLRYQGRNDLHCDAEYEKGDEMGYFQHGSTILVFASRDYRVCANVKSGDRIQMGQPLLEMPDQD